MNINRRRAVGLFSGLALLSLASISPAHAEGEFESHISGWYPGNESSRWQDNNTSSDWTGVYFQGCSTDGADGFSRAGIQLWKVTDWGPDVNYGYRNNYCGWVDWGDPNSKGQYYFKLNSLLYGGYLSVDYVKVGW